MVREFIGKHIVSASPMPLISAVFDGDGKISLVLQSKETNRRVSYNLGYLKGHDGLVCNILKVDEHMVVTQLSCDFGNLSRAVDAAKWSVGKQ